MIEMAMVYKHDSDDNMIFASMIDECYCNSETERPGCMGWPSHSSQVSQSSDRLTGRFVHSGRRK